MVFKYSLPDNTFFSQTELKKIHSAKKFFSFETLNIKIFLHTFFSTKKNNFSYSSYILIIEK